MSRYLGSAVPTETACCVSVSASVSTDARRAGAGGVGPNARHPATHGRTTRSSSLMDPGSADSSCGHIGEHTDGLGECAGNNARACAVADLVDDGDKEGAHGGQGLCGSGRVG